jgi:hypothetical protein
VTIPSCSLLEINTRESQFEEERESLSAELGECRESISILGGKIMSLFDSLLGYSIGILFIGISILFFKKRALFLIAGFDKENFSDKQINILAKSMGRFVLNTGVLITVFTLVNNSVNNQKVIMLIFYIMAIEFLITLALITYKCFFIKRIN